ncbi:MAG: purine-nucleoside phosphorylase [Planctomycetota bacterium]
MSDPASADGSAAIDAVADRIRAAIGDRRPRVGVVLGSGLGGLADRLENVVALPYADLPGFPRSTAAGHAGRFVVGALPGVDHPIIAMQGRFHLYEGWNARQAALPVWVMRRLGVECVVVSNAAGGLNPQYRVGDVVAIDDHINFMFRNPLVGPNDESLGPRFPDMSSPYDPRLIAVAHEAARSHGFPLHTGVYVAMLGPTYETRAEYRMTRTLGGDVVGMSTVPEVVAAVHAGMRVFGVSTVTNADPPDALGETTHDEVVEAAASAGEKLRHLVEALVRHVSGAEAP